MKGSQAQKAKWAGNCERVTKEGSGEVKGNKKREKGNPKRKIRVEVKARERVRGED